MPSRRSYKKKRKVHRNHPPAYIVSLGTVAAFLSLTAVVVVVVQPEWSSPLFGLPFGAYGLGALAALMTLSISYKWPVRICSQHPACVMAITAFRFLSAGVLGGLGYGLASAIMSQEGAAWVVAFLGGLAEKPVNDMLLGGVGFVTPPERETSP